MKNVRKLLIALCLVVVLVATAAVSAFAWSGGNVSTGSETNFEDYWLVNKVLFDDMENGTSTTASATASGTHTAKPGTQTAMILDDGKGAPYVYAKPDENGDLPTSSQYYSTVFYGNKESGGKLYLQPRFKNLSSILGNADVKKKAAETPVNGFVMEFDIATLSGDMDNFDIQVFNAASASEGYLNVASYSAVDGVAKVTGKNSKITVSSDKGGWLHITVLYDGAGRLKVYANKAQVDTAGSVERTLIYDEANVNSDGVSVYPLQLRMGKQDAESGSFSFDNLLFYQSTTVCDPDYMASLSQAELFAKYIDVIDPPDPANQTASAVQKFKAYETIVNDYLPLFEESDDPADIALVERYYRFYEEKIEELQNEAKMENAATYREKVDALVAYGRGLSNIYDRELAVDAIDEFIADVASLIFIGTDEKTDPYLTAAKDYEAYVEYLAQDTDVRTFKNRMDRFKTSTEFNSSEAMQRHYSVAAELIETVELLYAGDGTGFELYGSDDEVDAIKAAKTAFDAAAGKLDSAVASTNSRRFIDLMRLLDGTTRSDWDADTGFMRNLWYLARGIVEEGKYDDSVEGLDSAMQFYGRLHAFFWAKVQDEHVADLTARLDEFDELGSSYIDKAGVCTYVDNYIYRNYNDIDHDDARIKNIKSRNELYKSQLEQLSVDNSALLYQQTLEFKYKMDEIATLEGYAALKAAYDQATKFYYAMNVSISGLGDSTGVTNEQLKIAMARYEELSTWLLNVETMSMAFINCMQDVDAASTKDELYAAILACFKCEEYLDDSFAYTDAEGVTYKVSDCKGRYDSIKNAYVNGTATANAESAAAVSLVCATRAFSGIDNLMKYVQDNLK